jgi:hypothetical protein
MNKHGDILKRRQAEAMQKNSMRNKELDRLVEAWMKTDYGQGLDKLYVESKTRARNTAVALDVQEKYINAKWRKLSEAIASTGFEATPEFVLKVVRLGVANRMRGEMFNEVSLRSTDDAIYTIDFTYEQSLRDATAGDKIYEKVKKYYDTTATRQTIGTGNGATKAYTLVSTTYIPLYPLHVRIMVGGEYMGVDTGSGTLAGPGLNSSATNTVNYTTGEITINLTDNAPAGALVEVEYTYSFENSSNYTQLGTIGINARKNRFGARPVPLGYEFSDMSAIMLETTGLGDIHEYLLQGVADEHAKAGDYRAISFAREVAKSNTIYSWSADWAGAGAVDPDAYAQSFLPFVQNISADIYDETTRGTANTMILGSKALVQAKRHRLWKTDEQGYQMGVFQAGYLDNIKVFTCPQDSAVILNNEGIVTYKNPTDDTVTDLSLIFGTLTEISAELHYPELYTKGTLASVEDKIVYNSKYVRKFEITGL